ncbi:MAG TPA: GDP-mannose 4,6-dehydratase, partial [Candidatus Binataceae bacterium]|nr:GDP-mannose 4,6-dehydratase [Candidatus Binataceae bacterium]
DYVVATGETHSVREFLALAFERLQLGWQQYVEFDSRFIRPAEVDLLVGDASRSRSLLGWQPRVGFRQLVALMVDADLELAQRELRAQNH